MNLKNASITLALILCHLFITSPVLGQIPPSSQLNSAFIGEYHFTLFGHSSPNALVSLEGMGISDQTFADSDGYFEFSNHFSPFSPREACLTAQDQFGRTSAPVCLPPFPTEYDVSIGPVILPATLSFNESDYYVGENVVLSGQTIPNSEVDLSLFTNDTSLTNIILSTMSRFSLIKNAYAYLVPKVTAQSDNEGNYSIQLPSNDPNAYRLFTQTQYKNEQSPKSVTLSLEILPVWMVIVRFLILIFDILMSRIVEILILAQIVVAVGLYLKHHFHPLRIHALALRDKHELMKKRKADLVIT